MGELLSGNFTFQEAAEDAVAQTGQVRQHVVMRSLGGSMSRRAWKTISANWATIHTPDKCKYKDSECFNCHLTGHLQSECSNAKPPPKKIASKQHVHHTEQDSETGLQDNTADEYLGSIFATEESQK